MDPVRLLRGLGLWLVHRSQVVDQRQQRWHVESNAPGWETGTLPPGSGESLAAREEEEVVADESEVAQLLSMSRTVVCRLMTRKELFSVKVGGARRIPRDAVHAFVKGLVGQKG